MPYIVKSDCLFEILFVVFRYAPFIVPGGVYRVAIFFQERINIIGFRFIAFRVFGKEYFGFYKVLHHLFFDAP